MNSLLVILVALVSVCKSADPSAGSMMQCAQYNTLTNWCDAGIRGGWFQANWTAHRFDLDNMVCQTPIANPITRAYDCDDCDDAGFLGSNSTFVVQWPVGSVSANKLDTAGQVTLYLSPRYASPNGQIDFTQDQFQLRPICTSEYFGQCDGAPTYSNPNANCYMNCQIPQIDITGWYTLQWMWNWTSIGEVYTSCADVYLYHGSVPTAPPSPPSPPSPSTTSSGGHHHSSSSSSGGKTTSTSSSGGTPTPSPTSTSNPTGSTSTPTPTGNSTSTSTETETRTHPQVTGSSGGITGRPTRTDSNGNLSSSEILEQELWILWAVLVPVIIGATAFIAVMTYRIVIKPRLSHSNYVALEDDPSSKREKQSSLASPPQHQGQQIKTQKQPKMKSTYV